MKSFKFSFLIGLLALLVFGPLAAQNGSVIDLIPDPAGLQVEPNTNEQTEALGRIAFQIQDKVFRAMDNSDVLSDQLDRFAEEMDPAVRHQQMEEMLNTVQEIHDVYDYFSKNRKQIYRELMDIRGNIQLSLDNYQDETDRLNKAYEKAKVAAERDLIAAQDVRILKMTLDQQKRFEKRMIDLTNGQLAGEAEIKKFLDTVEGSAGTMKLVQQYFELALRQHDLDAGFDLLDSLDEMIDEIVRANQKVVDKLEFAHDTAPTLRERL